MGDRVCRSLSTTVALMSDADEPKPAKSGSAKILITGLFLIFVIGASVTQFFGNGLIGLAIAFFVLYLLWQALGGENAVRRGRRRR